VVGRGLLAGTSKTTFAPDIAMTRGMLVTALGRLAGVDVKVYTGSSFTDVKVDSTFRPYIEWAYKKGESLKLLKNTKASIKMLSRKPKKKVQTEILMSLRLSFQLCPRCF